MSFKGLDVNTITGADCGYTIGQYKYAQSLPRYKMGWYSSLILQLMLAGFCLAFMCSQSAGDDIFKPTGRFAKSSARQWFLVSEPWCILCPAAKEKFIAAGNPEANVISSAEAHERFGISVRNVPYEFPEPESQPVKAAAVETKSVEIVSGTVRHVYYTPRNMRRSWFSRCR